MLNHLAVKRYLTFLIILLISLTLFTCSKDHDEVSLNNPFDPNNPETHGDPYNLSIESGMDYIKLQWSKITGFEEVNIYRSTKSDTGFEKINTSKGVEYTDKDIKAEETYYYQLRAYKNGIEKPSSSIVSMKSPLIAITATAENGGSISPSGDVKVATGSSQTFIIFPNAGYSILDVKVDSVSKGNISSYTFSNVTTDHTIKAIFGITITITATVENDGSISEEEELAAMRRGEATVENGGSISPSGDIKVATGSSQTFIIFPNAGYSILDVKVDGVSKGNISSYTFSNVTADHTIYARFGFFQ